jgi:hypothetical protein
MSPGNAPGLGGRADVKEEMLLSWLAYVLELIQLV